jgi:hypothetical protein
MIFKAIKYMPRMLANAKLQLGFAQALLQANRRLDAGFFYLIAKDVIQSNTVLYHPKRCQYALVALHKTEGDILLSFIG